MSCARGFATPNVVSAIQVAVRTHQRLPCGRAARCHEPGTAVILGMTPELRAMALKRFCRVVTIESNRMAIAL